MLCRAQEGVIGGQSPKKNFLGSFLCLFWVVLAHGFPTHGFLILVKELRL
jgi:hypothetical protein